MPWTSKQKEIRTLFQTLSVHKPHWNWTSIFWAKTIIKVSEVNWILQSVNWSPELRVNIPICQTLWDWYSVHDEVKCSSKCTERYFPFQSWPKLPRLCSQYILTHKDVDQTLSFCLPDSADMEQAVDKIPSALRYSVTNHHQHSHHKHQKLLHRGLYDICVNEIYRFVKMVYYTTITILDIIHRPVFYLKHNVSDTGFCLCLQEEPTQFDPIDWDGPSPNLGNRIRPSKRCFLNKRQDDG
jgi:hypothetical protein